MSQTDTPLFGFCRLGGGARLDSVADQNPMFVIGWQNAIGVMRARDWACSFSLLGGLTQPGKNFTEVGIFLEAQELDIVFGGGKVVFKKDF